MKTCLVIIEKYTSALIKFFTKKRIATEIISLNVLYSIKQMLELLRQGMKEVSEMSQ